MDKVQLIRILCHKLPGDVSMAVYNEYNSRWTDIEHIWDYSENKYKVLQGYQTTVKNLLAMSTFYRRVLSGFDGARDFYKTITKSDGDQKTGCAITIGTYKLDDVQYRKLQAVQIAFDYLKNQFGIRNSMFEYDETYEFLDNCKQLYLNDTTPNNGKQENLPF